MKLLLAALPLLAAVTVVALRRAVGRPLAPVTLRVLVAVVTAGYLLVTAALGLFWVARMELPPFDLHYLFGYLLLAAVLWHLWLEIPVVMRVLRRLAPRRWLRPEGPGLRTPVRVGLAAAALTVAGVAYLALDTWRTGPRAPATATGAWEEPSGGAGSGGVGETAPAAPAAAPAPSRGGGSPDPRALERIRYLLRESSVEAGRLVRANPLFGARPRREPERGPVHPLPVPGAGSGTGPEGLERLAALLHHAAGVTAVRRMPGGRLALRAAASAGALQPVRVYLWARLAPEGGPALWRYLPQEHGLTRVRARLPAAELAAALGVRRVSPPVVILSGRFQRTVWKYGPRSLRYVPLDAGHVAANLWLAARALGYRPVLRELFDDVAVAEALRLDLRKEGALLAVALAGEAGFRDETPPFARTDPPAGWERHELTRLGHRLTSWRWTEGPRWRYLPRGPAEAFPEPEPLESADVLGLIRRRRSFRRFARRPVEEAVVRRVLAEVGRLARAVPLDAGVTVRVVACRVEGLEPGTYLWRDGWRWTWRGEASRRLYGAGLRQELLARAAAAVVFLLDVERLGGELGERGLRVGLLHAGMAGELVYLAADREGLGACGVGAFADTALRGLLGPVPDTLVPVYLVAVGHRS